MDVLAHGSQHDDRREPALWDPGTYGFYFIGASSGRYLFMQH